ncbi:MAG: hypothetical protein RLZ83_544 [Pseudomonadota bacterium]|jgi:pSer/pThr/pTyr-binding forkhead associated (FHA) protein
MNRLLMSIDGEAAREIVLTHEETTIGRKPHNDIVIDHLAVSSQHAVLRADDEELWIEDLKSTNGTYVNGQAVSRRRLWQGDVIELGKVRLEVRLDSPERHDTGTDDRSTTDRMSGPAHAEERGEPVTGLDLGVPDAAPDAEIARIRVLNGPGAGREVLLTRERTTIGKPGMLVVAIERVGMSHLLSQVEGLRQPLVNGRAIGSLGLSLGDGDVIELAGTRILFLNR